MKAAVIGLGVEGKKALNSLLKYNWEVYATDLNINIDLDDLPISLAGVDISPQKDRISFIKDNLSIDLSDLKSGIYFVKINTEKGNIVKRIIKD